MGSKFPKVQKSDPYSENVLHCLPEIKISDLNLPQTYRNEMMTHCYIHFRAYHHTPSVHYLSHLRRAVFHSAASTLDSKTMSLLHSVSPKERRHQQTVACRFCECHLNRFCCELWALKYTQHKAEHFSSL